MSKLEKQIEEKGQSIWTWMAQDQIDAFILGAKSKEAKAFHQEGMWTNNEVIIILNKFTAEYQAWVISRLTEEVKSVAPHPTDWFEQFKK